MGHMVTTSNVEETVTMEIDKNIIEKVMMYAETTNRGGPIYSTSSATRWPTSPDPKGNRKERRTANAKARRRKKHK